MMTKIKHPYLICFLSFLLPLFSFIQMTMLNVVIPHLTYLSHLECGSLVSLFFLGDAIFLIPAGILLDKFSIKANIIIAILVLTAGMLIFSFLPSYTLLFFIRFITGMAHAYALIACFKIIKLMVKPKMQGTMIGFTFTFAMLGGILAQSPLEWLIRLLTLKGALLVLALFGFILFCFICWLFPQKISHESELDSIMLSKAIILKIIKRWGNWFNPVIIAYLSMPFIIFGTYIGVSYFTKNDHLTAVGAAEATGFIFWGAIVGFPALAYISEKMNENILVFITIIVLSLSVYVLISFSNLAFFTIALLFFIIGFASGAQAIGFNKITRQNPHEINATAMGFASMILMLLTAIVQFAITIY